MAKTMNAKEHPDVVKKKKTEQQIVEEFLCGFEGNDGNSDGQVSKLEWDSY